MPSRRGNSEGTLRKRQDGRWEARYVGVDGKRTSLYGATRQEVARELSAALHDREQGMVALNERQTVSDYLISWLRLYRQRRRASSYERYERIVRLHLVPGLGRLKLARLTSQQIEAFYTQKLEAGCSPTQVRFCHKVLRTALADADRLGLVHRNAAQLAMQPRSRADEMEILTEEQARMLLEAARGARLEAFVVVALATGMREGELLALRWADVDLERTTLLVHSNLVWAGGRVYFEEAKTRYSRRRIGLPKTAIEALRRHRARQASEGLRLGAAWPDLDLVFPNRAGRPYHPDDIRRRHFYPLLERAGLPQIRVHDLRHTAATLLLARGVNVKVVSEMLGHANVSVTLSIYSHVLPHMQQHAVDTMDAMLHTPPRGTPDVQGSNQGSTAMR